MPNKEPLESFPIELRDDYKVLDVKKGGMGIVYICYERRTKRLVVLKTFQDKYLADRTFIDRFKWEVEIWVRLEEHHNIVNALFLNMVKGQPYIILEFVSGDEQYGADLSGWIWGNGLNLPLTLNFAIQFCHGMIHTQRKLAEIGMTFVHRDIKPHNIMVSKDKVVKVTDFGLAKAYSQIAGDVPMATLQRGTTRQFGLSKSGTICGTVPYMSPEQCRGESELDPSSDIYSFGCVLYEMLTGRYVFNALTPEQFIHNHINTTPKSPKAHKKLDEVVLKCLRKDPTRRYQDFEELERDLAQIYYDITGTVVQPEHGGALKAWELVNKGKSLWDLGYEQESKDYFQQAKKLEPNNARVHYWIGMAYHLHSNFIVAIDEYEKAIEMNPHFPEPHFNLGCIYHISLGNLRPAIIEYKKAIEVNPNYLEAHLNLGSVYHHQGDLTGAIKEFKAVLTLDPSHAGAQSRLELAHQRQNESAG